MSLAVRDIEKSKVFYEHLGFTVFSGDQSQNWLIMKNGDHTIGLFHDMFEKKFLPSILVGIVMPRPEYFMEIQQNILYLSNNKYLFNVFAIMLMTVCTL